MSILLTGGAGYIGSHVLMSCLEAGKDVVVLDNFSNSSREALTRVEAVTGRKIQLYEGDIRDNQLLERIFAEVSIQTVMHFAGLKSVGESVGKPLDYYAVNVCGSVNVASAMAAAGVFRLVFSSTAAVYGDQDQMPLTESSSVERPESPYGRSKLAVEQMLEDLCRSDPRWSVGILRYFNPVGAHPSGQIGEDPDGVPANLVPYAMQVAAGRRKELSIFGDDYPTPDGTGIRDYVHVVDLSEGHLAAMAYLETHEGHYVWNLGTGRGHSVREVIQGTESVVGRSLDWSIVPRRLGDTAECWADPSRAHLDLGWRAMKGLNEMLADHWRWQCQNPTGYSKSEKE